ncbi:oligosaccharide flippase family protein [Bacillus wiedmannii]|uniref:oligosaccharide flippase family protein n=1 Tax=Bacillus wiedmannii TaxID=1890302 RepID=UPI00027A95B7|nr:oligosaccharide flippase family protein [Bacillus wiedmannii]EJS74035.1 hypothetical protein ICW_00291 [Bacillus wiedmannii]PEA43370.1 polysaccharide biosynthesis protein [Bacillus wiedmannii]
MEKTKIILQNKSHPVWVFIQQFAVRGLLGIKFLLIARLLEPKEIGIISIALISLTLAEALTEIGIMQAVVQSKNKIDHHYVIWTLQCSRGFFITLVLLVCNSFLVNLFGEPEARNILILVAFVPLVKNLMSAKYYSEIRVKNFRAISIVFGLSSIIDLTMSLVLVSMFKDPIFAILSLLVAELIKSILTHVIFGWTIKFDFRFYLIKDIMAYGRWIWGNSISSFVVNQFDKIVASTFLGTKLLGLYQMSQKMTQLAVADISFAAGQYLFPQFSSIYRANGNSKELKKYYSDMMLLMFSFAFMLSGFVIIYAEQVINIVFGDGWEEMLNLIQFMMIGSSLAAIMNISVVYNRAIGKPKKVTLVSYVQLGIFVISCLILVRFLSAFGLVISSIFSYIVGLMLLNMSFKNKFAYIYKTLRSNLSLIVFVTIIICLMLALKESILPNWSFAISIALFFIGLLVMGLKFKKLGDTK